MSKVKVSDPKMFDLIRTPVVTEKSTNQSAYGKVTFRVAVDATKPQIKRAVEEIFGVDVTQVNTIKMTGKTKRFRGTMGRRPAFKKAVVTLKEGQSIDIMAGV